jgi:hypothetical protein
MWSLNIDFHVFRKVVGQAEMDYLQNVFCIIGLVTFPAR